MAEKTLGQVARDKWRDELVLSEHTPNESWQAVANAVIAEYEARRWRPISEAHEDCGVCAFINIHEPEPICASTLDDEFAEMAKCYGWTHFCRIALTHADAERLMTHIPAPPKEADHGA